MDKSIIITKAIILAAGKGTRMKELSLSSPKPLIKVKGKALIDYKIEMLQDFGIKEFVVNISYLGSQVKAYLNKLKDVKIHFSEEEIPLETGGGIKKTLSFFENEPFFALNSDTIIKEAKDILAKLQKEILRQDLDVCLCLVPFNKVIGHDKSHPDYIIGDTPCIYSGICALNPRVFKNAPNKDIFSLKILFDYAEDNRKLGFIIHDNYLFHVGTPEALSQTEQML